MILVGREQLSRFKLQHADARQKLDAWEAETKMASWKNPHEMKERFPSADTPGNQNAIFDICGNKYRIWAKINYQLQTVIVKKVGTHVEYNGWKIE